MLVLGGVSYDTLIYLDEFPKPRAQTVFSRGGHETIGSTGAGKALNLSRLGFEVTCHALIGADEYGDKIRREFQQQGIHFIPEIDPQGTERHLNLMAADGARISIYFAYATPDPAIDISAFDSLWPDHDYIVMNINNYCRRLIPGIRNAGKEIWCDIHDWDGVNEYHKDFVNAADYLFFSSDAMPDYRNFMQSMIDAGKQLVVCTHGRQGSTALTRAGEWIDTPVINDYIRRDTNGAGDAFFSGYLYGHANRHPPEQCLRWATLTAGLCVTSTELAHPELSPARIQSEYRIHYGT